MGEMLFQRGYQWDPIFYTSFLLSPENGYLRIH